MDAELGCISGRCDVCGQSVPDIDDLYTLPDDREACDGCVVAYEAAVELEALAHAS